MSPVPGSLPDSSLSLSTVFPQRSHELALHAFKVFCMMCVVRFLCERGCVCAMVCVHAGQRTTSGVTPHLLPSFRWGHLTFVAGCCVYQACWTTGFWGVSCLRPLSGHRNRDCRDCRNRLAPGFPWVLILIQHVYSSLSHHVVLHFLYGYNSVLFGYSTFSVPLHL